MAPLKFNFHVRLYLQKGNIYNRLEQENYASIWVM